MRIPALFALAIPLAMLATGAAAQSFFRGSSATQQQNQGQQAAPKKQKGQARSTTAPSRGQASGNAGVQIGIGSPTSATNGAAKIQNDR